VKRHLGFLNVFFVFLVCKCVILTYDDEKPNILFLLLPMETPEHASPLDERIPVYRKIQGILKEKITSGEYAEGTMLPSEHELCEVFKATRMTVRQALKELVLEGYITRKHGKGSTVSAIRKSLGLLSLKGWTEVVSASERHGQTTVLRGPIAERLSLPIFGHLMDPVESLDFFVLERLRSVEQDPVMLETTYLPVEGLDDFATLPLIDGSVFRTLFMRYKIDVQDMVQEVKAVSADRRVAQALGIKAKSPVLHIVRRYSTSRAGFYLYSSTYCNTDKYAVSSFN